MNKKACFLLLLISVFSSGNAQLNLSPIWCFGQKAGLDFSVKPPSVFTTNMVTSEGSGGATNGKGELLFYSDGRFVYNKLHMQMPNGFGLTGSPSSSQSAIVLQHPSQKADNQFYIFTVPEYAGSAGFCYSIVDMDSDNGLGDVVRKNVSLFGVLSEQMQPAMHSNGKDYWIVIKGHANTNWYSFLIDENGVSLKQTANLGNKIDNTIGCMRFNKQYSRFAYACYDYSGYFQICDFNNTTGVVSNAMVIDGLYDPYGVGFSPNGDFIYVSHLLTRKVKQYDLRSYNKTDILNSAFQLTTANYAFGNLNYAYDGKLYMIVMSQNYLACINDPDKKGVDCNFSLNSVNLGTNTGIYGLPLFYDYPKDLVVKLSLDVRDSCMEDSVSFVSNVRNGRDTFQWYLDTGNGFRPMLADSFWKWKFYTNGKFKVRITKVNDSIEKEFNVMKCLIRRPQISGAVSCIGINATFNSNLIPGQDSITWKLIYANNVIQQGRNASISYQFLRPGQYYLKLYNQYDSSILNLNLQNCSDSCAILIPNAFTPGDDNINDSFMIVPDCYMEDYRLLIFNRWGEKLYDTTDPYGGWDGRYYKKLCPDGVYLYLITFKNRAGKLINLNGVVHLLR